MIQLLKINLVIFIFFSFPLLGSNDNQNKDENHDIWKQSTKSYIKNFNNLAGAFTQIDHAGNVSKGNFWINEKNQIAFHYNPPSETKIIYKSGKLFFKERRSESFQNYSVNNNPILELLNKDADIDKYLETTIIDKNIGKIYISFNNKNERNSLEVIFDYPKPILRQWNFTDHQKKKTNIFFSKLKFKENVEKQYFITK
mgnify:FL=1|tara:strand:+ start:289 stop:885 length:597 start_codon:yes stop_codon:yes gene_type:complete